MKTNRLKQQMREGKMALYCYAGLADPAVVEILGLAGYDGVVFDTTHFQYDLGLLQEMIRAADATGVTPVVRLPLEDLSLMMRLLDMGAQGLQVTNIRDRLGAQLAVNEVRYPPVGHRGGFEQSRAADYGAVSWQEHMLASNEEILLALQVEDLEGLRNLEEIASVDGVDTVNIGPHDLTMAMGFSEPDQPEVRKAIEDAARRLRKVGNARLGFSIGHPWLPITMAEAKRLGVVYANAGPSVAGLLLDAYTKHVMQLRQEETLLADG